MENPIPDINLLPKHERTTSTGYYIFIGLLIVLIVAYGLLAYSYFSTKSNVKEEKSTHTSLLEDKELLETQIDESATDEHAKLQDVVAFIENHTLNTSIFMEEVNNLRQENSYVSEYLYADQEAEVILHFETLNDIADYTTRITNSDLSKDVQVDEIDTFSLDAEDEEIFQVIPRYESIFTIQLQQEELREELEANE